jgi:hypothetical protein
MIDEVLKYLKMHSPDGGTLPEELKKGLKQTNKRTLKSKRNTIEQTIVLSLSLCGTKFMNTSSSTHLTVESYPWQLRAYIEQATNGRALIQQIKMSLTPTSCMHV